MMMMKMKKKLNLKNSQKTLSKTLEDKVPKMKRMKRRKKPPGSQKVLLKPPPIKSESEYRGPPP